MGSMILYLLEVIILVLIVASIIALVVALIMHVVLFFAHRRRMRRRTPNRMAIYSKPGPPIVIEGKKNVKEFVKLSKKYSGNYEKAMERMRKHEKITKKMILLCFIAALLTLSLAGCGASWERTKKDWDSNLSGGLNRIINIYSMDGKLIRSIEGKIDIEVSTDGKVKFDLDGKRYIYYNCMVESIEIDEGETVPPAETEETEPTE